MTLLATQDRGELAAEIQREISANRESTAARKSDWRVLIDALDSYLDQNAANINGAIQQPQRGTFTTREKALAMQYVIQRRYLQGV